MVYTFGLAKYANSRYRDSANRLSRCELIAMLHSLSVDCDVSVETLGGSDFLTFECRQLSDHELLWLSGHSSVVFLSENVGGMLRPLSGPAPNPFEDLPEILKYKGKTSAAFTRMMINMARSLLPLSAPLPLTLLDPVCGKGTACFCALEAGMNAMGLDIDHKAVKEAADYFSRYLKLQYLKHSVRNYSETLGKASLPVTEFVFSDSRDNYQLGVTRSLRLASGDTAMVYALCRRHPVHLLIADFPYGVQHAPRYGTKPESFRALLGRALPEWKKALAPGGVAAVSFNTLTFPRREVLEIVNASGFIPCDSEEYNHLRHEVEQAVVRDVVFMMNPPDKGGK